MAGHINPYRPNYNNTSYMALIFDLETTGLPDRRGVYGLKSPDYRDTKRYDGCRVVQVSYMLCDAELKPEEVEDAIIQVDVPIPNADIHGITDEICRTQGVPLATFLDSFLPVARRAKLLVAHNAEFDVNVFKSELLRQGFGDVVEEMERKTVVCTMQMTRAFVGIRNQRFNDFKPPRLGELYKHVFGREMEMWHHARHDVENLHRVLQRLFNDGKLLFDNGTMQMAP